MRITEKRNLHNRALTRSSRKSLENNLKKTNSMMDLKRTLRVRIYHVKSQAKVLIVINQHEKFQMIKKKAIGVGMGETINLKKTNTKSLTEAEVEATEVDTTTEATITMITTSQEETEVTTTEEIITIEVTIETMEGIKAEEMTEAGEEVEVEEEEE